MVEFDAAAIALLESEFYGLGSSLVRGRPGERDAEATANRRFRGWFGVSTTVASKVWTLISETNGFISPTDAKHKLLWALRLLKSYETEENFAASVGGVDEKTARKHAWLFINLISYCEADVVSDKTVCDRRTSSQLTLDFLTLFRSCGKIENEATSAMTVSPQSMGLIVASWVEGAPTAK